MFMVLQEFDAVLVCNGHFAEPNVLEVEGREEFTGLIMHSHNYRTAERFKGQRVVVVGAAFSGRLRFQGLE